MLETERLQIVAFQPEYLPDLVQLFCREATVMQSVLKGRVYSFQELQQLIASSFTHSLHATHGFWCLFHKNSKRFAGIAGLLPCEYLGTSDFEFGFILRPEYWGQGLATEIGGFSIEYGRDQLQLPRILATTQPDNKASQRVLEKLGLHYLQPLHHPDRGERWLFKMDFPVAN